MKPKFRKFGLIDTRTNKRVLNGFHTKAELLDHYFTDFLLQRGYILKQQYDTFKKFLSGGLVTNDDIKPFKVVTYGNVSLSQGSWADMETSEAMEIAGGFQTLVASGENLKHKAPNIFRRDSSYSADGYESDPAIRLNISANFNKGTSLLNKIPHKISQVEIRLAVRPTQVEQIKLFNRLGLYTVNDCTVKVYDDFIKQILDDYPSHLEIINVIRSNKDKATVVEDFYVFPLGCSIHKDRGELTMPSMSRIDYAKGTSGSIREACKKLQSFGYSNREAKRMLAN